MKISCYCVVFCVCSLAGLQAGAANTVEAPASSTYAVVANNANSRVVERTVYETDATGKTVARKRGYVELATGLNHLVNGRYEESKERIDVLPNGTAAATNGQHQAYFPGDIYEGQIELVTAEGLHLRSRPVALGYDDGDKAVLIAELTNSVGVVVGDNQVLYTNAFTGIKAHLRYTYTKSGFVQDVILCQQPPAPEGIGPESIGLNPKTARLQVWTEFFSAPKPIVQTRRLAPQKGVAMEDQNISFGTLRMIPGRAFSIGQESSTDRVRVAKRWVEVDLRQFLVEEVLVEAIAAELAKLPLTAMNSGSGKTSRLASQQMPLPAQRLPKASDAKMTLLAKTDVPSEGYLLDYQAVSGSVDSYTFRGDTTYYLSGTVYLSGTTTFEGGTVIKYAPGASLVFGYEENPPQLNWLASAYRPVVLTAKDDNSVGEVISGSTGNPTNYYASYALSFEGVSSANTLSYFRIAWASEAIFTGASGPLNLFHGQVVHCGTGIDAWAGYDVNLRNVLLTEVGTAFNLYGAALDAQHTTFGTVGRLADYVAQYSQLSLENCVLANVSMLADWIEAGSTLTGTTNGFYNSPVLGTGQITNTFYPFETAGAASYYLTNGCAFRDKGTTNIDTTLLADLRAMTTWSPLAGGYADANTLDLGYHYPQTGNDSTGTNFWLAFASMNTIPDHPPDSKLSLFISSSQAATGTVTCLREKVVVSGCGNAAVNGDYLRTNIAGYPRICYVQANGTMEIGFDSVWPKWGLVDASAPSTILYERYGSEVAGNNWANVGDGSYTPPVTTRSQYFINQPFSVTAGKAIDVAIPIETMITEDEIIGSNGISVTASQPVSVYAFCYKQAASTAFNCYPTTMLGTNYCVLTWDGGELAVVATASNTTVNITPASGGYPSASTITLQPGQTYQVECSVGVQLASDKPVAVFAGNVGTPMQAPAANPLMQEQLAVEQWGTNALSVGFAGRLYGDTYRVLAASNSTTLWTNGVAAGTMNASEYLDFIIDGPVEFKANKPIQVAHFGNGWVFDNIQDPYSTIGQGVGDPCEILLPVTGRYLAANIVHAPTYLNPDYPSVLWFHEIHLNLIVDQTATNSTLVDGLLVSSTNFISIGTSGYYGAKITVTNGGTHTVTSSKPVGVGVYGWGPADAYGYLGGTVK